MTGKTHVPDGWCLARLGDVAEVNPRRPRLNVTDDTPVRFLPMAAVGEQLSGVIERQDRPYREVSSGYTYFEEGDVIFAKITPCLQNGKHALLDHLPNGIGFGSTEFHVVRADSQLDPRHLFRVLTQPQNIRECVNSFTGTAGQQRVQPEVLKSLPILFPSLPEQRVIAAVLDAIDDAIERGEAVIATTERLRDALLHELLTWGVPGWHSEWKVALGIGTIPACWDVVRLGNVAEVNPRRPRLETDENTLVDFIPMTAVGEDLDGIQKTLYRPYKEVSRGYTYFESSDILFAKITPCLQNGKHTLVDELREGYGFGTTEFHVLRAGDSLESRHLFRVVTQPRNIRECADSFTGTAGQQRVQPDTIRELSVPLPPLREQQAIADALDGVDEAIERGRTQTVMLKSLKASAADALLSGRVRVGLSP